MSRRKKSLIEQSRLLYTHYEEVGNETEVVDTRFESGSLINGRSVVLEYCQLNRTRIIHAAAIRFTKCELETVDAANAVLDESGWNQVRVHESRWTGAQLNFAHMADVMFDQCQMNHAQLQECTLKNTRFEHCDLRGAYFNGSKMEGTVFAGSNLTGADFSRADITKCDFRRANIEEIRIAPDQLRGVIVTQDQALYLARLLGLDVRE